MSISTNDDVLINALSSHKKTEEKEIPDDNVTFTVPKKFLSKFKEGDMVTFKYLLDDGDNVVLMPEKQIEKTPQTEQEELEEEIKAVKEQRKPTIKKEKVDVKDVLSKAFDEADKAPKGEE